MLNSKIKQVELSLKEAKAKVKLGDALLRLQKNRDFKLLIEEGFFIKEASRLVAARGNPVVTENPQTLIEVDNGIIAIGGTQQYFNKIMLEATQAEKAIEDCNQELDILNGEDEE